MFTPSRKRCGSSGSSEVSRDVETPSPIHKKRKRPKMDFDRKLALNADDLFKKDVFLAVKAYVDAHPKTWSVSLMCDDISEQNGWLSDQELLGLVKASLKKLGFSPNGAFQRLKQNSQG